MMTLREIRRERRHRMTWVIAWSDWVGNLLRPSHQRNSSVCKRRDRFT